MISKKRVSQVHSFSPLNEKRAQMEMSVGTIVTIVLLMTVLILGLVLVRTIFRGATGAVDLTEQQLRDEIQKLFSEEKKLVIYPSTKLVELKHDELDGVGIGIKNLQQGTSGADTFSYAVTVADDSNCGNANVASWIELGQTESNIPLSVGELTTTKVLFRVPTGSPLCTARFRVNVASNTNPSYATDFFDISVNA